MFDDLIGKPYLENGRGPDGYDCYGICMEACSRIGVALPELKDLLNTPFNKVDDPALGDLVYINSVDERHIGFMENSNTILQVIKTGRRGVHRININHPWIKDRIAGYYRYAR